MDKRIEDASNVFDALYKTNYKKFLFLPNWQKTTSYWFQQEYDNKIQKTYKKYPRGSIVYIDFGINIGHEFSGRHFGIVLNKKDSPYNSLITVVPLTSKNKSFYLPLDNIVFKTAIAIIDNNIKSLSFDVMVSNAIVFQLINIFHKHNMHHDMPEQLKESIDKFALNSGYPTDPSVLKVCNETIEEYNLFNSADNINTFAEITLKELLKRQRKMDNLDKIISKYSKFNKNTFACTQNIITISKLRILKINEEDPSKNMKIDNNSLDLLDNKIKEQLFN